MAEPKKKHRETQIEAMERRFAQMMAAPWQDMNFEQVEAMQVKLDQMKRRKEKAQEKKTGCK